MEGQARDRVEEKQEEGGVVEKEDRDGIMEEQAELGVEGAEVKDLSRHAVDLLADHCSSYSSFHR